MKTPRQRAFKILLNALYWVGFPYLMLFLSFAFWGSFSILGYVLVFLLFLVIMSLIFGFSYLIFKIAPKEGNAILMSIALIPLFAIWLESMWFTVTKILPYYL